MCRKGKKNLISHHSPTVCKGSFSPSLQHSIQAVDTTANVDSPENGLEALAQVVSCEDIIGWRSRDATGMERGLHRVVLFLTDDQFHYSGEGRVSLHRQANFIRGHRSGIYNYRDGGQV